MGLFTSKRQSDGGFTPPLLHRLLKPPVSGNTINGVGETRRRRPTPLYHHQGRKLAYEWLQRSFYAKLMFNPRYWPLFREVSGFDKQEPGPIAPRRRDGSPGDWSRQVRDFAVKDGAALVGMVPMRQEWVFAGYDVTDQWIILLGVTMDHAKLMRIVDKGVDTVGGTHVIKIYNKGTGIARKLADWIRAQGYEARGASGPMAGPVNLIPAALEAGFGELGKHGSIINRHLGSNFRLAYVLTELPLLASTPDVDFGVDEVCGRCKLCTDRCPPDAINENRVLVRGVDKWYVDFDKCVPYFNDSQGCGICIAVCPWSRPGVADNLTRKMLKRRQRKEAQAATE